jgi:hypothetical protein
LVPSKSSSLPLALSLPDPFSIFNKLSSNSFLLSSILFFF